MGAVSDPIRSHFRSRLILYTCLGIAIVGAYLWMLFNAQVGLLVPFGIVAFGLLLLCPVLVAYQSVHLTLQMDAGTPIRDAIQSSLRRSASLLLLDALIAIPLFVLFSLYLQIALAAIFGGLATCQDGICSQGPSLNPNDYIPQAIWVLLITLGLWGLNLLASILGASLAQRWRKVMPATSGTILALVVTVAIVYTLLNLTALPQIPLDLLIAVLPYLLAWGAWHYLTLPAPVTISASKP